jgi:CubicO group peptidase (beta-lactamase class C family)
MNSTIMSTKLSLSAIDSLVEEAIDKRVWPGAVVLASKAGQLLHAAAYGSTMYADPGSQAVQLDTIYDIASLTKVFSATALLQLIEEGMVQLDAPVARYLAGFRESSVTVRHLLTHTSGLDLRLSALRSHERAKILELIYQAPLKVPAGSDVAYTNINSLLVGEIVAQLRQLPLEQAIQEYILDPLGLRETMFNPSAAWHARIAPSEIDEAWRGGLVHGKVHDESCYALGGVAGHAGLFSTAYDLLRFCEAWLAYQPPLISEGLARDAVTNQTPNLRLACGYGWMLDRVSFMGQHAASGFGHTGFTGPAIIALQDYNCCVVVLCNRTYPRRAAALHHGYIAQIVDAVVAELMQ